MQELPRQAELSLGSFRGRSVVDRVAHQRMLRVLHMHANLVGASGEQLAVDERVAVIARLGCETLKHAEGCDGLTSRRAIAHRHARALGCRARNGRIDHAGVMRDDAVRQGEVTAINRAVPDVSHKHAAGGIGFRREHEPGGVAVEAMHDTQSIVLALDVAQMRGPAMMHERVDERSGSVVDGRVAHQPRLLGKNDHVVVFEADIERDGLAGNRPCHRGLVKLIDDGVSCRNGILLGDRGTVDEHASGFEGTGRGASAGISPALRQHGVDARTRVACTCLIAFQDAHRPSSLAPIFSSAR